MARGFCWENVVFRVENVTFCVPKHEFVRSSPIFKDMYLVGDSTSGEGTREDCPIVLEGYVAKDFEALLMILYPSMEDMQSGKYQLTKEQLDGVLRLSRPWEMAPVRQLAIKTLSNAPFTLTPTEKVTLAREHKVASWLVEGLTSLTINDPPLSRDELVESVGLASAFRILSIQFDCLKVLLSTTAPCGVCTALSFTSVGCSSCTKPYLPADFGCHSCGKVSDPKGPSGLYIRGAFNVAPQGSEMRALYNLANLLCHSCNNRAVTRPVSCRNCPYTVQPANNVYTALGSLCYPASTVETMIREQFKDEIEEYDS